MPPEEEQRAKRRVLPVFDDFGATWGALARGGAPESLLRGRKRLGAVGREAMTGAVRIMARAM